MTAGASGETGGPRLAPRTVLLHVGVPKTGTTALQSAMSHQRQLLRSQGVLYPGSRPNHASAVAAAATQRFGWGDEPEVPRRRQWSRLLREISAFDGAAVISSETLCQARSRAIHQLVGDLAGRPLHVLVTVRPLAELLASSWQQYLKSGLTMAYDDWLKQVFADPPSCPPSPSFWKRHDHARVVRRWASAVGADNLTVVVVDPTDRSRVPAYVEAALGLEAGVLSALGDVHANRSLTAAEAAFLRRVNVETRDAGLSRGDYGAAVRFGAVLRMVEQRDPQPGEQPIVTPGWALDAASDHGRRAARRIRRLAVHVVGDIQRLAWRPSGDALAPPATEPGSLPVEAAVHAVVGTMTGLGVEGCSADSGAGSGADSWHGAYRSRAAWHARQLLREMRSLKRWRRR